MYKQNFDYNKTMMMKMIMADPDNKGGSKVYCTFEQALERIKILDNLTVGAPKIFYLVGWQYLGHDDCYPAFFEVNKHLKRECDNTATESLAWLMKEAKKHHTTVSLHINLSDAYPDSPLWQEYIGNDLILLNGKGKPKVTGTWNNRKAYQVRFAQEYKSGYFKKRVDELMKLVPICDAGTVHIDAFFVRKGKDTTIDEEKKYRKLMVEYFNLKGVDVTSEFIYREWKNGHRSLWGKSDIIGVIPAVWNLKMTAKEFIKYPSNVLAGGTLVSGLQRDMDLQYLFYSNIHGEDILKNQDGWQEKFLHHFAVENLPYFFLNGFKREKITGMFKGRVAHFSNGVKTQIKHKKIIKDGNVLKENETLCLPLYYKNNEYFAYSKVAIEKNFKIVANEIELYKITSDGSHFLENRKILNNSILLNFQPTSAFLIKIVN